MVGADSLAQTSECFISKLATRLHKSAKSCGNALRPSLSDETNAGKRTYDGKRNFAPLPKVGDGFRSFPDERHRYLSSQINAKEHWADRGADPDMQSTQMSSAKLIRSMKIRTRSMTPNSPNQAYLHLKITESYFEFDTRFRAVFSALPWRYLVDCAKSIIEESQRNWPIRSDASKCQGIAREANGISDMIAIARSMGDIDRLDTDGPEVRAKYRTLSKELSDMANGAL